MKHSTPKAKFSVNGGTSCFILPVSMGGVTIQAKYPVDVSTLSGEIAIRTECAGVIRFCLKGDTSKTVEIDWGDGTIDENVAIWGEFSHPGIMDFINHTYTDGGLPKTIKITPENSTCVTYIDFSRYTSNPVEFPDPYMVTNVDMGEAFGLKKIYVRNLPELTRLNIENNSAIRNLFVTNNPALDTIIYPSTTDSLNEVYIQNSGMSTFDFPSWKSMNRLEWGNNVNLVDVAVPEETYVLNEFNLSSCPNLINLSFVRTSSLARLNVQNSGLGVTVLNALLDTLIYQMENPIKDPEEVATLEQDIAVLEGELLMLEQELVDMEAELIALEAELSDRQAELDQLYVDYDNADPEDQPDIQETIDDYENNIIPNAENEVSNMEDEISYKSMDISYKVVEIDMKVQELDNLEFMEAGCDTFNLYNCPGSLSVDAGKVSTLEGYGWTVNTTEDSGEE